MEKKHGVIISTIVVVLATLTLIQTANAASMFIHNVNIPRTGAQVTFTVNDETVRYQYNFHRFVTQDTPDLELPLPTQFQSGDYVSVTVASNYFQTQTSDAGSMSNTGAEITIDLSDRLP